MKMKAKEQKNIKRQKKHKEHVVANCLVYELSYGNYD